MSDKLKNFSDELKQKREDKNITLQSIHQKTRIDIKFLTAIEEGNFDIIDYVYVRAFIKGYANSIGLDAEETLKKFDSAKKGKLHNVDLEPEHQPQSKNEQQQPTKKVYSAEKIPQAPDKPKQSQKINPIILIGSSVLVIIFFFVYFVFIKSESTQIIKERSFDEVLKDNDDPEASSERFEIVTDNEDTTERKLPRQPQLNLKINAVDTTWLKATIDDVEENEFTLYPNQSKGLTAKGNIKLLIGNAAGINMFMNDSLINFEGDSGEIKKVKIDYDGLRYLKIQETKPDAQ